MQTIINHVENNANANNHSGFHLIVLMQPPEDVFALSLIPREVVESQTIARCIRWRSKAVATMGEVASMRSPTPACWALCLKGGGGAVIIIPVAGDGDDFFIFLQLQSFFIAGITTACSAPVGPHVAIPEKKWDWTLSLTWRWSQQCCCHISHSSWWRSRWVWIQPPSLCRSNCLRCWHWVPIPSLKIKVLLVHFSLHIVVENALKISHFEIFSYFSINLAFHKQKKYNSKSS